MPTEAKAIYFGFSYWNILIILTKEGLDQTIFY